MNHGSRFRLPLPPATGALFLVNLAVFVVNALAFGRLGTWFAFSWSGLWDGYGLGLLRLVSYQFTHSFQDPLHLVMNMVALWVFGPMAEARLGRDGLVRLYLWAGFLGALGHLALQAAQGHPGGGLIGASGACYGLLVYAACLQPQARIVFLIVQMPLWGLAALLIALGAYQTFVELATGTSGGVSHSAHLGGALLGYVAYRANWFVEPPYGARPGLFARWRAALRARSQARAQAAAAAAEQQLDAILAKVKVEGITALRPEERRVLEQASRRAQKGH
ncbi:MAG: rhomboid family intramembrane serine protease [Planctomycetes bacterium]|jgi:membrane associated rhomboid family serine protease|nr:rhomboid family intramembrane serine protease [Planctomycetota bacterium]